MKYKQGLELVIAYLEGKVDIYNGNHPEAVRIWNEAWDEMKFLGYDPETVEGIRAYIINEL